MRTFRLDNRFDPRTGEPADPAVVETGEVLCDYSGMPIDGDDRGAEYETPDASGSEEFWYYDELEIDGKRVDLHRLNSVQPRLAFNPSIPSKRHEGMAYGAEVLLMLEWQSERNAAIRMEDGRPDRASKDDPVALARERALDAADELRDRELHAVLAELGLPRLPGLAQCDTIAGAMHLARYRAIRRLLAGGRPPTELGVHFEGEDQ